MEMTIEQKQKNAEKSKEWRLANPEKVKESSKRNYEKNKEKYSLYYKKYYQNPEHKQKILETGRKWREQNRGDFVYKFLNESKEVLYIGSTARCFVERVGFHLLGYSNLELTAEQMVFELGLEEIKFQNFKEYNLNRQDLYFIEAFWKQKEKELLGKKLPKVNESELSRSKEELIELTNKVEWEIFDKLDKYLN